MPKTKDTKKSKAKDSSSEDRPSRGQGHKRKEFSKKKKRKKDLQKFFSNVLQEKPSSKIFFQAIYKIQQFKMCPRGQGRPRVLHLWPTHKTVDFDAGVFRYRNDRRPRRVFLCFYLVIFQLTSAKDFCL